MKRNNNSILASSIIGVVTLFVTLFSATFAYFGLNIADNSVSSKVTADLPGVRTVTLSGDVSALNINLSASDITDKSLQEFWATKNTNIGFSSSEEKVNVITIAPPDSSDEIEYACSLKVNVVNELNSIPGGNFNVYVNNESLVDLGGFKSTTFDKLESKDYELNVRIKNGQTLKVDVSAKITSTTQIEPWLNKINGSITATASNMSCYIV